MKPLKNDGWKIMADNNEKKLMVTIFLKHQQYMNLQEINKKLEVTGFWKEFPPQGVEVVSWYVMMGIGQVVTLQFLPEKLRDINLAIEKYAWGAFETEFYCTYDFKEVWKGKLHQAKNAG